MTNDEAKRHLEAARLMLLRPHGQPVSDLYDALGVAIEALDAGPVHGYDTSGGMSLFTCSVCGWHCWDTYCGDTDTYNYCPNCGALMDGKENANADS